jgi:ATP-binding cassette subfamily B (MDR/TAP) protein 1
MLSGKILSKAQCPATAKDRETMSKVPYALAIGSIMYAILYTRPDVSNALSLMSRYQSDPGVEHLIAVKNILKYLNRTKEIFLVHGGDEQIIIKGYIYASFDTDPDDSKS